LRAAHLYKHRELVSSIDPRELEALTTFFKRPLAGVLVMMHPTIAVMGESISQTGGCALQEIHNCQPRISGPNEQHDNSADLCTST
jgi:hypothetical protein